MRCKISPLSPAIYLYISRIYIYILLCAKTCTHIRGPATGVYIHIYTDVLGTEIWRTPSTRLDLRLFNSSACQKHQCTLCSLIVLFRFLFLCLSRIRARSLSRILLSPPYAESLRPFSLFLPFAGYSPPLV